MTQISRNQSQAEYEAKDGNSYSKQSSVFYMNYNVMADPYLIP